MAHKLGTPVKQIVTPFVRRVVDSQYSTSNERVEHLVESADGTQSVWLPVVSRAPDALERAVATRVYGDGTTATGVAPLPDLPPLDGEGNHKVANGPRVTLTDVDAEIVDQHFFTAANGVVESQLYHGRPGDRGPAELASLTFCVLVLRNGTKVVGINYGASTPRSTASTWGAPRPARMP